MQNTNATDVLFDVTRDTYATAFDVWNQGQARALRWTRLWLDELEATQQESRRVAEDLLKRSRRGQEAWLSVTQDSLRNVNTFWRWPGVAQFEEMNSRLDDLNRRVESKKSS